MRKKFYIVIIAWLCSYTLLVAQNSSVNKELKKLLKEAQFYLDAEDYFNSYLSYKKVLRINWKHEVAGVNSAFCILKLNYHQDSAIWLTNNLSVSALPDANYFLAKIHHQQKQFDAAILKLENYLKTEPKKRLIPANEITYFLDQCKSAKILISKPHSVIINNMGATINSIYDDYVPVIMPDESALYFTSKRKGSSNNKKNGDNSYFEDVYVSTQVNGQWKKAENVGFPINSNNNDACVALSGDGLNMIIYRTSEKDQSSGHLYTTHFGNYGHWEPLKLIGPEINSPYTETSACFSKDSNEIYFSSNRPGGFGGKDIYRVRKFPNGKWAVPYNLGAGVNTAYDDDAPFIHPDGVTLYFSSKGHNSMGNYDVFKSVFNTETSQYSKAENLGYPINDIENDIFFVLSVDGQRGYYSSVKSETFGGSDIYQIDTRFTENDLVVKQCYIYLNNKAGRAQITLSDLESNEMLGNYMSNSSTGKFIMVVNPFKSYRLTIEEDGFETLETNLLPAALEQTDTVLKYKLKKSNAN